MHKDSFKTQEKCLESFCLAPVALLFRWQNVQVFLLNWDLCSEMINVAPIPESWIEEQCHVKHTALLEVTHVNCFSTCVSNLISPPHTPIFQGLNWIHSDEEQGIYWLQKFLANSLSCRMKLVTCSRLRKAGKHSGRSWPNIKNGGTWIESGVADGHELKVDHCQVWFFLGLCF